MPSEPSKKTTSKSTASDANPKSILDSLKSQLGLGASSAKETTSKAPSASNSSKATPATNPETTSNAILGTFSKWYYGAEDRYYDFLDRLSTKIPVYSIIDPIDRVFPSFILFLLLALLLFIGLTALVVSTFFTPHGFTGLIQVVDSDRNPIEGAQVTLLNAAWLSDSKNVLDTNADGFVSFPLANGDDVTIRTKIEKDGFSDKELALSFSSPDNLTRVVTLSPTAVASTKYLLEIHDQTTSKLIFDSSLTMNQNKSGTVKLFCLTNATNRGSQTFRTSTVELDSSKIAGCSRLQVTVEMDGYEKSSGRSIESDLTSISLKRAAVPKTSLTVRTKDANTGKAVAGITIKVRSEGSSDLTGLTDESGVVTLEVSPAVQSILATDHDGVYADATKTVDLTNGTSQDVSLSLTKLPPDRQRKIALKIVDSNTNAGVAANVHLYKDYWSLDESQADSAGLYSFNIGDINSFSVSPYFAVISEPSHITTVVSRIVPIAKNDSNVLIVKILPVIRDVNDNPLNGFQANMWVKADNNVLLSDIDTYLYSTLYNFPLFYGKTNSNGLVSAYNLPASLSYYAQAFTDDANGQSVTVIGQDKKQADLNITLITGEATIKVNVKDINGAAISNALVTFSPVRDGNSYTLSTSSTGDVAANFKVNQFVNIKVSKAGYDAEILPSVNLAGARGSTITIPAILYPVVSTDSNLDLRLEQILSAGSSSSWQQASIASTMEKGGQYYLRFRLRSKFDATNAVTYVVADNPALSLSSSVISVTGLFAPTSSVAYYPDANMVSGDLFDENGIAIDVPAKRLILRFDRLAANTSMVFFVKVKVSDANAVPVDANFEVQFGSKTATPTQFTGALRRQFQLKKPLCVFGGASCPALVLIETIRNLQTGQPLTLSNEKYSLVPDWNYQLLLRIYNASSKTYNDVAIDFNGSSPDALSIDINHSPFSAPLNPGLDFSAESTIRALKSSDNANITAIVNQAVPDNNKVIPIRIVAKNTMRVQLLNSLTPGLPNPQYLYLNAQDASTNEFLDGVLFLVSQNLTDFTGAAIGHSDASNKTSVKIPIILPATGSIPTLYLHAVKPGYLPYDKNIVPGIYDPIQLGDQNWDCLKFVSTSDPSISIDHFDDIPFGGGAQSFKVISTCDQNIMVTLKTPVAPTPINMPTVELCAPKLTLSDGSNTNSTSCPSDTELAPFTLTKNSPGKNIKVERSSDRQMPGTYGIYAHVQPVGANATQEVLAKRLIVTLSAPPTSNCLALSQTAFNFQTGSIASAELKNNCPYLIPNVRYPDLMIDRSNVFLAFNRSYNSLLQFDYVPTLKVTCTAEFSTAGLTADQNQCLKPEGCSGPSKNASVDLSKLEFNEFNLGAVDDSLYAHKAFFKQQKSPDGKLYYCSSDYSFVSSNTNVRLKILPQSNRDDVVGEFTQPPSADGVYDFNLFDQGVQGDEYGVVTAEDYTSSAPTRIYYETFPLKFKITDGNSNVLYDANSSGQTIEADGKAHFILNLAAQQIHSNTGVFKIENLDVNLDINFNNPDGSFSKIQTTHPDANVSVGVIGKREKIAVTNVDIVFLVDTSGSMDVTWQTVCEKFNKTVDELNRKNLNVQKMVYGMGGPRPKTCANQGVPWGDPLQPIFTGADVTEAWAATGQSVINDYAWREDAYKVLVIVTDNAPGGRDNGEWDDGGNAWRSSENVNLVKNIISIANSKKVHLYFSYASQLEGQNADITNHYTDGDDSKVDSREAYENAASATGGNADVYSADAATVNGETIDSISYAILKATYPTAQQFFHVLMEGGKPACYGPDSLAGSSGPNAVPKLAWTWNWNNVSVDTCAARLLDGSLNPNASYCDSTQFSIFSIKRLHAYETAVKDGNLDLAQKLANFEALLQKDGFSDDFRDDFDRYIKSQVLASEVNWYTGPVNGFSDIFKNPDRFKFSVQSTYSNLDEFPPVSTGYTLTSPGHYLVRFVIQRDNSSTAGFFDGSAPNATITVRLKYLHTPIDNNPFYYMPLDGKVGFNGTTSQFERTGYGASFTGDTSVLIFKSEANDEQITSYGGTALSSGIRSINQETLLSTLQSKGIVLSAQLNENQLTQVQFEPSRPSPVLAISKSKEGVSGLGYQIRKNNVVDSTASSATNWLYWTQIGSDVKGGSQTDARCLNLNGNQSVLNQSDQPFANLGFSCQPLSTSTSSAFGMKFNRTDDVNRDGNKAYFRAMVFTPLSANYQLEQLCSSAYNQFKTTLGSTTDASKLLELNFNPLGEGQTFTLNSWESVLKLTKEGINGEYPFCVQLNQQQLNVFWNAEYVYKHGLKAVTDSEISEAQKCFVPSFAR